MTTRRLTSKTIDTGEYVRLELNEPNVRRSLFPLAGSIEEFLANIAQIAVRLDKIG